MYLDNELHKKEARFGNWRCLYCNKVFKTEHYLESHIENRHPATIMADGVCLADYCDVLECDMHHTLFEPGHTGESLHCNPNIMQRRRHRCHMVLDQCFPPHHSQVSNQLHHDFENLYCDHLTCDTTGDGSLRKRQPGLALKEAASARAEASGLAGKPSGWRKLIVVFGVLFALILFIFYLGVCLYQKDMTFVSDLRKVPCPSYPLNLPPVHFSSFPFESANRGLRRPFLLFLCIITFPSGNLCPPRCAILHLRVRSVK